MGLYKQFKEGDLIVGIWKIEEEVSELLSLLPDSVEYSKQIEQLKTDNRKKEWLSVRLMIYTLLNEEKKIAYSSIGKPYFTDNSYQLSISHTKGYAAVILHPERQVGVDIEKMGDKVIRVKNKFLQPTEQQHINNECEVLHLLLYFSAKETVYKLLGIEALELKAHLFVEPFMPHTKGFFNIRETKTIHHTLLKVNYQVYTDFVLTYSVK